MPVIIAIFIIGDVLEFVVGVGLFKAKAPMPVRLKWDRPNYLNLIREALPQMGVVLITSSLARFDWIFIGFMLSAYKLAEYSFAYKLFEIASLPIINHSAVTYPPVYQNVYAGRC
jgi:O-antigen/teichoic acid export membrane protein